MLRLGFMRGVKPHTQIVRGSERIFYAYSLGESAVQDNCKRAEIRISSLIASTGVSLFNLTHEFMFYKINLMYK